MKKVTFTQEDIEKLQQEINRHSTYCGKRCEDLDEHIKECPICSAIPNSEEELKDMLKQMLDVTDEEFDEEFGANKQQQQQYR